MRAVILFFLLFMSFTSKAQNYWSWMELAVLSQPTFNLNSATALENEQVVSNSLEVTIRSEFNYGSIYASIPAGITSQTQTPMGLGNVRLEFNHTTCPASSQSYVNPNQVALSNTPTKLFTQRWLSGIQKWYFDVIIPPLGYAYQPGTYNFTIVFTMTQP